MAIGRRLFDMARSELNDLLQKASRLGEDDDVASRDADGLEAFSEAALEAELRRRKVDKPRPAPRAAAPIQTKVTQAYAALELTPGADFAALKQQYRRMMRKYHPDHHTGSPEKEKAAHELTQKLTEAYKVIEQQLRNPPG